MGLHLGQVAEDAEGALGHGDVHGVPGADVDGRARLRENHKVVPRHRALVLDRVVLHLPAEEEEEQSRTDVGARVTSADGS